MPADPSSNDTALPYMDLLKIGKSLIEISIYPWILRENPEYPGVLVTCHEL
jgi:hypothetical protein